MTVIERLLHAWQLEDMVRAYGLDYPFPEGLSGMAEMMRAEGVAEGGHLAVNNAALTMLCGLHTELLRSPRQGNYTVAYNKALPFIVELRARGDKSKHEVETCLDALYGIMLLRMQGKEISTQTMTAINAISALLRLLAEAHELDKQGLLEL